MRVLLVFLAVLGSCRAADAGPRAVDRPGHRRRRRAALRRHRPARLGRSTCPGTTRCTASTSPSTRATSTGTAVRASGVDFAFIKATEGGDHADDRFRRTGQAAAAAGHAARRLPLLLLLPHRRPSRRPGSSTTCRATARRCRRCSTSSGPTSRGPAAASPTPRPCAPRRATFLQLLTGYYGKRPLIYTTVDFYRDNELWQLDGHHFWLRSVAGHPVGRLSRPALGLLAVHRHRRRRGHRRPDRPQRLRRRPRAMGRPGRPAARAEARTLADGRSAALSSGHGPAGRASWSCG